MRTFTGRIDYLNGREGQTSGLWGYEDWRLTEYDSGLSTLNAHCELWDDPVVVRGVVQTIDSRRQPRDAVVRLSVGEAYQGSAMYRFGEGKAICRGFSTQRGEYRTECSIGSNIRGFGTHALVADGWLTAHYDRSAGSGEHVFHDNLMSSLDHRGATGPDIEKTTHSRMLFEGEEDIAVAAGRFRCGHFAFSGTSNQHPRYDLWVSADHNHLFVKGEVPDYNWYFELKRFDVIEAPA